MSNNNKEKDTKTSRRRFLKLGVGVGAGAVAGFAGKELLASNEDTIGEGKKVKMLTTDGKLVEVEVGAACESCEPAVGVEARKGLPGRNFVMVIDLAKCANARKCTEECQKGHNLEPDQEWMQVNLMKDNEYSEPYWFPKTCYHCDNPPCVKVCPVGATYKRQDGIVLVDVERCIGCKFCISACPYSVRVFNWKHQDSYKRKDIEYSPETSVPGQIGTVGKCDFCPDLSRLGKLPYCVKGCPMGALYFGDMNEDAISNGEETLRFKETIKDRTGYRYLEELGTKPRVYYLPPVDRMFDFEDGLQNLTEEQKLRYQNVLSTSKKLKE